MNQLKFVLQVKLKYTDMNFKIYNKTYIGDCLQNLILQKMIVLIFKFVGDWSDVTYLYSRTVYTRNGLYHVYK
jgi:hypothetical protein